MNHYNEIKNNLIRSELYDKAKDYSKDRNIEPIGFNIELESFLKLKDY